MDLLGLLHSRPAIACGTLAHKYLKNKLLALAESTAVALFLEQPNMLDEMKEMLREIESDFTDGYDPGHFVVDLPLLQSLDSGLRDRLLAALRREYDERFHPEKRLDELRLLSAAFVNILNAWFRQVAVAGVSAESAPLWEGLQEKTIALREFLEDRELCTRWIP